VYPVDRDLSITMHTASLLGVRKFRKRFLERDSSTSLVCLHGSCYTYVKQPLRPSMSVAASEFVQFEILQGSVVAYVTLETLVCN
jgi:hypothetical protein